MSNESSVTEFLLLGFSEVRELQLLHFVLFLVIYLAALIGNLLIITLIALEDHLHTPMYFFLMILSIIDLGSISVTIPKAMANSLMNTRLIPYPGCVAQVFFLLLFLILEVALLTVMSYDLYVAICDPLHYETVMNRGVCIQMAAISWIIGLLYATLHTGSTFSVTFCSNIIDQFFCEIPHLLKLSCSDSYLIEVGALAISGFLVIGCFIFIILSYVQIFRAVLRIPSVQGRQKAISTCLPHLIVVSMFISTGSFAYLKPTSSSPSATDLVIAVAYAVVPQMMNPVIYSMRNREIKAMLWKMIDQRIFSKEKLIFHQ
uniref:G-protein coupled receptors family 1 profile domain-containing protein n=1 Tax=Sphenodon punctatus TaxID=8508 RepID=A0A8D0GNJ0_SPHPU